MGVVRNAVPSIDMSEFKRELVHATKVVTNELNDKQSRVNVRYAHFNIQFCCLTLLNSSVVYYLNHCDGGGLVMLNCQ